MGQVFIHLMALVFTIDNTFEDVKSALDCDSYSCLVGSGTSPFDLLNELVEGFEGLETGELTLTIAESLLQGLRISGTDNLLHLLLNELEAELNAFCGVVYEGGLRLWTSVLPRMRQSS